jgi:protein tyrosine/serine phosphatase
MPENKGEMIKMSDKIIMKYLTILLSLFIVSCSPTVYTHGIPNLVKVDSNLWRSGQPTALEQWQYLKSLGITQVVKLNFTTEGSDSAAKSIGMKVYILSIQPEGDKDLFDNITKTFIRPDPKRLDTIEQIVEAGGGILVHCTHGQDRTGLIIGRYRVLYDKWTKDSAYSEMLKNHFHPILHGLKESWEKFDNRKQEKK